MDIEKRITKLEKEVAYIKNILDIATDFQMKQAKENNERFEMLTNAIEDIAANFAIQFGTEIFKIKIKQKLDESGFTK